MDGMKPEFKETQRAACSVTASHMCLPLSGSLFPEQEGGWELDKDKLSHLWRALI